MLESGIEQKLKRFIEKEIGGKCYKWVCPGMKGPPDRICILPGGIIIFVELKRPDGKGALSVKQEKIINVLQKLGCNVRVVDSQEAFQYLKNDIYSIMKVIRQS